MPSVIQIRRQPTGYETFGQSMQDLSNNFVQSMLSMAQQQNTQNMQMMGLGMQERRLADYNTRQDKQLAAADAARKEEMTQRLQMHNDTMALHRQQLGIAMDKLSEERAAKKRLEDFLNGMNAPASGGAGGGIPGLDAAFNAAISDVEQPGFGDVGSGMETSTGGNQPLSPAIRRSIEILLPHLASGGAVNVRADAPALDFNGRTHQELLEQTGLWPPKPKTTTAELMERAGLWPLKSSHAPTPGSQRDKDATMGLVLNGMRQSLGIPLEQRTEVERILSGLAPMFGVQLDTPAAAPADSGMGASTGFSAPAMLEQPKRPEPANVNGLTLANFPPHLAMYPGGKAVFETLKERDAAADNRYKLDMKAWESQQKQAQADQANMDKQDNALMLANSALRSADQSLNLLNKHGKMATGSLAREWLKDGTWGRSLGLAQGMDNLEEAMKPMKTVSMMEMIDQLKKQSPTGALGMRITQLEAVMMSGVLGSLETSQTPDQLRASILAHKKVYNEIQQIAQEIKRNNGRGGSYSPATAPAAPADSDGWEDI